MKIVRFCGVLLVLMLAVCTQAFEVPEQAACRPGKTVSISLALAESGEVTAFLAEAESESLTFVRCETGEVLKSGYTRGFGSGGKGSFVFAAGDGATPVDAGEAVVFVFSAPDESGEYAVHFTISQICGADGEMTDRVIEENVNVTVDPKAVDSPTKDELPPAESEEEPGDGENPSAGENASVPGVSSVVNISLPSFAGVMSGGNGFLAGVLVTVLLFVVGLGVYACLIRRPDKTQQAKHAAPRKKPPKDPK